MVTLLTLLTNAHCDQMSHFDKRTNGSCLQVASLSQNLLIILFKTKSHRGECGFFDREKCGTVLQVGSRLQWSKCSYLDFCDDNMIFPDPVDKEI